MKNKMSFEEAISKLEGVVDKIEGGELSLDDSLKAFEEAVSLVKYCNAELEKAEQKVRLLIEGKDGEITDTPFLNADDET